jgi:glutathione S-transferase
MMYTHPYSGNARRAATTVLSLDVPCELVTLDLRKGQQREAWFPSKTEPQPPRIGARG